RLPPPRGHRRPAELRRPTRWRLRDGEGQDHGRERDRTVGTQGFGMTQASTSRVYDGISGFEAHVGEHLGYSEWRPVTQKEIDLFAEATGDHQWIHVDEDKAAARPHRG